MDRTDGVALIPGIMQSAINSFNSNEIFLLTHNVSERCICAKFAGYLERELYRQGLVQYSVDVEYNRNTGDLKRLHDKNIVVDLIVHKRGCSGYEDVKNAKMAECLADRTIPATLFQNVYVPDLETKEYIEELFRNYGITEQPPYVNVWPELFLLNEQ